MIHTKEQQYTIYNASCLDVMDSMEENSIDCIVTDPPYEIGFMGKKWDNTGIAFNIETWKKALRVLKPGGYLLAFNHSRTFHRMMVAIEDAGFELRDTIMWLYGSGFPKSHNIAKSLDKSLGIKSEIVGKGKNGKTSKAFNLTKEQEKSGTGNLGIEYDITKPTSPEAKQWDGWGSALKPAFEPIVMARKPFKGSLTDNVLKHGVGGINIDECRIETEDKMSYSSSQKLGITKMSTGGVEQNEQGRFPANIIHDGSDEACSGFPNTKSGDSNGFVGKDTNKVFGKYANNVINKETVYADEGSASRYFYTAKASVKDRNEGLGEFDSKFTASAEFRPNHMEKALEGEGGNPYGRWQPRKNIHPTVKPTELMQYLIRLVTPKGGTVLDPFMGSGSTGKAAMIENTERNANYHFIGVDLEKEYCEIAKARIEWGINFKIIKDTHILYNDEGKQTKVIQDKLF